MRKALAAILMVMVCSPALAQYGDIGGLKLLKPEDKEDVHSTPPPSGAIVLFDGRTLENWEAARGNGPAPWKILPGGIMQAIASDIKTKQTFDGRFRLHVEFRVPYMPRNAGQARGNSGVYVQGRYEVQVLDSYGSKSQKNDCGAIYGIAAPLVNVCKAPTVWQNYDIEFQSPVCEDGKKKEPAVMTVYQNGTKIQDAVKITSDNTTSGLGGDPCTPGPIMLQFHGDPVQYRNVWLVRGRGEL
jgi:hypothetical protein